MSEKPVRPDESECCGSGCKPCIFDIYEERLQKWKLKQENVFESKALNQIKYLPFLITKIQNFGDFIKIFQFQSVTLKNYKSNEVCIKQAKLHTEYEILNEFLNIKSGEYLILKGISESETFSRSYTPIVNKDSFQEGAFTIVISLQPNGKMSEFFKSLQISDIVFWRGPYTEFNFNLKLFKHILLFGGGTGIVPLYNIAKSIVEDEDSDSLVKVFASFKTTSNIILREEFGVLRDFWNFEMKIYITNRSVSGFQAKHNESIVDGKIDETVIEREVTKYEKDEFFVIACGPNAFNHFVKNCFNKFSVKDENIFIFW